jgi:hypothetical protein
VFCALPCHNSLPCGEALPCVSSLPCVELTFVVRRREARTAKTVPARSLPSPSTHRWPPRGLFAVCMHMAKWPNGPLPCTYTRQRGPSFSDFFCFLLIPAFQNCKYIYIYIYNLKLIQYMHITHKYITHSKSMHTCMHITYKYIIHSIRCIHACI